MIEVKQLPKRQRYRKALLFVSLLLFPVTLYYFSPVIIMESAAQGIVNASFIVFAVMFVSALFVGRLWCGWMCPAGALQEFGSAVNNRPGPSGRSRWIKWAIWIPWLCLIILLVIKAGGYRTVNPFYQLDGGVTLAQAVDPHGPPWYVLYYIIVALFLGLCLVAGRRAGCHTVCWMAPFMISARRIRNLFRWPALGLRAESGRCTDCLTCTSNCPMSLDVNQMVRAGNLDADECILCGTCVDGCPNNVIGFSFSSGE